MLYSGNDPFVTVCVYLEVLLESLHVANSLQLMQTHEEDHSIEDEVEEVGVMDVRGGVLRSY